jgi:hypothetical protein
MSFDLTVVFTGLTGFVENTGASRARMCVLLPKGDPARTSSFDKSPLRRHRAFVKFPIGNVSSLSNQLESRPLDDSVGIWYLRGDRVFFQIVEDPDQPGGGNDFQINQTILPHARHPRTAAGLSEAQRESFSWALDMQRVFPGFQVDPLLLARYPPADRLAAQVFIDRGKIATKSMTTAVWRFQPPLSSAPYEQVLAHEVKLSFTRLVAARLMAQSFDPAQEPRFLDLTGLARGGQLLIEIVNTCDLNPLQWKSDLGPSPDEDSKWIFELADPDVANAIRAIVKLDKRPLPIPVPAEVLTDGIGSPGSGNCIPPRLAATRFKCAELDGAASHAGSGLRMSVTMPVPASDAEGATPLPPAGVRPGAQPPQRTFASAAPGAARPVIQYIPQRNDHWCWAACCAMALSQQGKNKPQCDIAGSFFRADCCPPGACDAECKVPQVEKVFRDNGLPQTKFLDSPLSQQELAAQLNAGGTVAVGRRGAANHMVLVAGATGQSFIVYDPDPNFGVGSVSFAEILQQAQGTGAWAWTWQDLK